MLLLRPTPRIIIDLFLAPELGILSYLRGPLTFNNHEHSNELFIVIQQMLLYFINSEIFQILCNAG